MNLRENRVGGGIWTGLKGGNRRGKHIYIYISLKNCVCVCAQKRLSDAIELESYIVLSHLT